MVVREVKLMALTRRFRLHQYLDDWLIRAQSQEEAQVNTQTVVDLTQSLGWIINQEKSELKPTQVFSFVVYEYHLDSALVKSTQERWLKLQDLILRLKSKHVLTARCLMLLIGLLSSTGKMVPEGCLHMRPFQFHLKELKAVSLALQRFKDQCQTQTLLIAMDNSTVVAYINKQGGIHLVEMCALLWKIMTWCHHYQITLKARHIPGCLNVMADLLSRSNQVQSTEWLLHPQVFKQICHKWFTPPVDLFATRLNHKIPLYVSPVPDQNAWDIDALNINRSGLTAYAYPPSQGDPKNQALQLSDLCNSPRLARDALVLGPSATLNRDPTATTSVKNSSQTVPQLCVCLIGLLTTPIVLESERF